MKIKSFVYSTMLLGLMACFVHAQEEEHSDVEFGYDNLTTPTMIDIEFGDVTTDGFGLFEAGMEILDPLPPNQNNFQSDEPGFATHDQEGLLVNAGDQIFLTALDASAHSSFGVGYVNFYNPVTDSLEAVGRLGILDNSGGTADLVLSGGSVESGPLSQFVGAANAAGDIHDHVIIDLLDDATAPNGAYGVLFQLDADFAGSADGNMDASSEAFWIVWNHGMDEGDFDTLALPKFGFSAVPEPSSAALLTLGVIGLAARRRRA